MYKVYKGFYFNIPYMLMIITLFMLYLCFIYAIFCINNILNVNINILYLCYKRDKYFSFFNKINIFISLVKTSSLMENYLIYRDGELSSCSLDELNNALSEKESNCISYLVQKIDEVHSHLKKRSPLLYAERELEAECQSSLNLRLSNSINQIKIAKQSDLDTYEKAVLNALGNSKRVMLRTPEDDVYHNTLLQCGYTADIVQDMLRTDDIWHNVKSLTGYNKSRDWGIKGHRISLVTFDSDLLVVSYTDEQLRPRLRDPEKLKIMKVCLKSQLWDALQSLYNFQEWL